MENVNDLVGKNGILTRPIKIIQVMKAEDGAVDVLVNDDYGNEFWVEMDGSISLYEGGADSKDQGLLNCENQ